MDERDFLLAFYWQKYTKKCLNQKIAGFSRVSRLKRGLIFAIFIRLNPGGFFHRKIFKLKNGPDSQDEYLDMTLFLNLTLSGKLWPFYILPLRVRFRKGSLAAYWGEMSRLGKVFL